MQPTPAEIDVITGLVQPGATVASVAQELGITEHAAKKRLVSLYRRLGVNSAAQAIHRLHLSNGPLRNGERNGDS